MRRRNGVRTDSRGELIACLTPAFVIARTETAFLLTCSVAGMRARDIRAHIEDDALIISGERTRLYECFRRRVPLPSDVSVTTMSTRFHEGLFTVSFRRQEQPPVDYGLGLITA